MGTLLKPENTDLPAAAKPNPGQDTAPEPMPDPNHADCRGVASVLSRVGDKWSVFVIMMLSDGPKRFNELKRMINGISQRMLTLTLRGLERDGLVTRTIYPTIPPRVDYELTELGHSLKEPVQHLGSWAFAHLAKIQTAREHFDKRAGGQ